MGMQHSDWSDRRHSSRWQAESEDTGFWVPDRSEIVTQFFTSPDAAVAWMAHVGGFVFGVIVAFLARTNDGFRNRLWNHRHQVPRQGWDNRLGPI